MRASTLLTLAIYLYKIGQLDGHTAPNPFIISHEYLRNAERVGNKKFNHRVLSRPSNDEEEVQEEEAGNIDSKSQDLEH
jgi:hypothetical protein